MTKSDNGTGFLSREQILKAKDLSYQEVEVPEWGGRVRVRELTGGERQEFDATIASIRQDLSVGGRKDGQQRQMKVEVHADRVRVKLCALTMVDEKGERLFQNEDQVRDLAKKSARALERVYEVSARLSGLSEEAVEEAGKGSGDSPAADSSSASASL